MTERAIVIVTGRCVKSKKCFGLRFERRPPKRWAATWSFALKESEAKKEGYDQTRISGSFVVEPSYPGCPHCGTMSFSLCGDCEKLACYDGESSRVVCPWCGEAGDIGSEIDALDAGMDR